MAHVEATDGTGTLPFLLVLSMAITGPIVVRPGARCGADASGPSLRCVRGRSCHRRQQNPELIPQWYAWGFAFRIMGGSKELPTTVYRVVSAEERALILAEAQASLRRDQACQERVGKLVPLVGKEKNSVMNAKQREIQLDCRRDTLQARDRLLERLNPEGQTVISCRGHEGGDDSDDPQARARSLQAAAVERIGGT